MLAPHRVNYDPLSLWKTDENGLKRVHLHLSSKNTLFFIEFDFGEDLTRKKV